MTQDQYRSRWLKFHSRQERGGVRLFKEAVKQAIASVPFENMNRSNYETKIFTTINPKPLEQALSNFYVSVGTKWGLRVGKSINTGRTLKVFEPTSFENAFLDFILKWIRNEAGEKIATMTRGLAKHLTKIMADMIEEGGEASTIREITARLRERTAFRSFYRFQILRIVQTETTSAANLGAVRSAVSSGVQWDKEWISAQDGRVRRNPEDKFDHRIMNGVRVPQKDAFSVPFATLLGTQTELMEYPGDQGGSAANVINCRCTVAVVPRRDADGLPIFI